MVRKEHSSSHQRVESSESLHLQSLADLWLAKVRSRLPDTGTAAVTVHKVSRRRYLVSFRATAFGETFISEAREDRLEDGLREAGQMLFERLLASPPTLKNNGSFGDRVRRLFSEAE